MRNPAHHFGAILVDRDAEQIVAEGVNRTHENPIWHGEIVAINEYASNHAEPKWPSLDLYTTAEPCPMCQAAILWARIPRVIYGTSIMRLRELGWDQIDILAEEVNRRTDFTRCQILGGFLRTECDRLFRDALEKR